MRGDVDVGVGAGVGVSVLMSVLVPVQCQCVDVGVSHLPSLCTSFFPPPFKCPVMATSCPPPLKGQYQQMLEVSTPEKVDNLIILTLELAHKSPSGPQPFPFSSLLFFLSFNLLFSSL